MGLEAATYIQDLDSSNPLAGDKKNQGDDHLRLLKAVLKATLPNANRAYYLSKSVSQAVDRVLTAADENLSLWCSTGLNITLPAVAPDGWQCGVVKNYAGAPPIYVLPPSGTLNGFAKIRCDVRFHETRFMCLGGTFFKIAPIDDVGELKPFAGSVTPDGYGLANGQSLLRADHPELFAAWGTTWGAADGTHFNAPDVRDRFLVGAGSSYALGATGGEATHVLTGVELPAHFHGGTTDTENTFHGHSAVVTGGTSTSINTTPGALSVITSLTVGTSGNENALHAHNFNTNNAGGGAAHENRPPYLGMNYIFRLC